MANFCSHCGKILSGTERFCPNCGSKLDKNGSTISTENMEQFKNDMEPLLSDLHEMFKNTSYTNDYKMHSIESVEEAEDDKALNKSINQSKKNVNRKRRERSNDGIIIGEALIIIGVIIIVGAIIAIIYLKTRTISN